MILIPLSPLDTTREKLSEFFIYVKPILYLYYANTTIILFLHYILIKINVLVMGYGTGKEIKNNGWSLHKSRFFVMELLHINKWSKIRTDHTSRCASKRSQNLSSLCSHTRGMYHSSLTTRELYNK